MRDDHGLSWSNDEIRPLMLSLVPLPIVNVRSMRSNNLFRKIRDIRRIKPRFPPVIKVKLIWLLGSLSGRRTGIIYSGIIHPKRASTLIVDCPNRKDKSLFRSAVHSLHLMNTWSLCILLKIFRISDQVVTVPLGTHFMMISQKVPGLLVAANLPLFS